MLSLNHWFWIITSWRNQPPRLARNKYRTEPLLTLTLILTERVWFHIYFSQQINNTGDYVYNMVCLIYIATKIYTLRIKRHMCVFVYVYNKTGMDMKNETRWACFIRLWNMSEENGTLIRDWQDPTAWQLHWWTPKRGS